MMSYDCRTTASAPITRPEMTQHFLPAHFSPAPMPSPVSPQYQASMSYGGYNPYSPPQMLDASYKTHEYYERAQPRVLPAEVPTDGGFQERVGGLPLVKRSCSPSIKSEVRSTASEPPSPQIDSHETKVQGAPMQHQFNTAIDKLVRVIEAKREILSHADMVESLQADERKEGIDIQVCPKRKPPTKRGPRL